LGPAVRVNVTPSPMFRYVVFPYTGGSVTTGGRECCPPPRLIVGAILRQPGAGGKGQHGDMFARAISTPPWRRNREKMKFSDAGPAVGYGKRPLYGNTFARANRRAGGKYGGRVSLRAPRARLGAASAKCRVRGAECACLPQAGIWDLGFRPATARQAIQADRAVCAQQSLRCSRRLRLKTGNALCHKDLRIWGRFRNVPIRSRTFRNFPFRSGVLRPDASGFRFVPFCSASVRGFPVHWRASRRAAWPGGRRQLLSGRDLRCSGK